MKISRLDIESFRRIKKADISFEPATFLIGPNNTGKSSVIAALEALLSLENEKLTQSDIFESPHSRSKCNSGDFGWGFITQAFPGPVVNT